MFYQPRFWVIRSHYISMFFSIPNVFKKECQVSKKMEFYCSVFLGENLEFAILELSVKMKSHMSPSCNTIKTTPKRLAFPISGGLSFFDWVIESPQDLWISSLLWGQSDGPNGCGSKLMSKEAWKTRCDQATYCRFGSLIFIDFATFKQYRYNFSCFFSSWAPKSNPSGTYPQQNDDQNFSSRITCVYQAVGNLNSLATPRNLTSMERKLQKGLRPKLRNRPFEFIPSNFGKSNVTHQKLLLR